MEKELNRQIARFEEQVKTGSIAAEGNIRFADFAERYMVDYGRPNLKPTTLSNYQRNLVRINQAIGHIRLKDLTTFHINSFYRNLQEESIRSREVATCKVDLRELIGTQRGAMTAFEKRSGVSRASAEAIAAALDMKTEKLFDLADHGEPLAPATIRSYHRTISSILEKAVKWNCILNNPAEGAELPSMVGHKARYLDEPDARKMLQLLQAEPIKWRAPITFDLLSGLRRAELLGLRWQDVDLDTGVLHIVQTSNYVSGTGVYVSTPKTEGSDRYLKVSRTDILMLLEYKAWQDDMREKMGDAWEGTAEDDRIFTNEVGRPMFPTSLTQWRGKFIKRSGLPPACVHSLRHTYASLLIAEGTPLVVVSNNLGHTQVSTTSDIYSHVVASAEAKAAQVTDKFAEDIHPNFTPSDKEEKIS